MPWKAFEKKITLSVFITLFAFSGIAEAQDDTGLFGDWGGAKSALQESGISVEGGVFGDITTVASGGQKSEGVQTFLYQLGMEADTAQAELWENGTFVINFIGITGGPIYEKVGDLQYTSSLGGIIRPAERR